MSTRSTATPLKIILLGSLSEKMPETAVLKSLGAVAPVLGPAQLLAGGWESPGSPGLCLWSAAQEAKAERLLFWPLWLQPNLPLIRTLLSAAKTSDWVFASPSEAGPLSAAAAAVGLPRSAGLCGPFVVRRRDLESALAGLDGGDPMLLARALRRGVSLGQTVQGLDFELPAAGPLAALGVHLPALQRRLLRRSIHLAVAAAMIAVGVKLTSPAVLALTLFGFGILLVGHALGRPE